MLKVKDKNGQELVVYAVSCNSGFDGRGHRVVADVYGASRVPTCCSDRGETFFLTYNAQAKWEWISSEGLTPA